MKLESLENKSSSAHVAVRADDLIRKMYRHILQDNCIHCKHILSDYKEAGNQPAPQQYATTDDTTFHPNQREKNVSR